MKSREQLTRAELLAELRRRDEALTEQALRRSILELQVYREELKAQNEELIAAQKELASSRDRYAELYDSAPVGYLTLDANGVVEEINATGARLLEQEPERLTGQPFLFAVAESEPFLAHMMRCRRGDENVVSEISLRTRNGRTLVAEIRSHPTSVKPARFRTTLTDLSEQREAEAERRELVLRERVAREANEAKDRFLAILSHELRNPLAAIAAGAAVLTYHPALPGELRDTVERIDRNAFAEARLITELLDASRMRHGKLHVERQPVDLHRAVEDVIAGFLAESPALEIRLDLQAPRHVVDGDAGRLGQVLSNLLRNARDATIDGGEIRVLTHNPGPGGIVLSVVDGGRGIEAGDLARIFNPFEQSAPAGREGKSGLGLGLAIAKGLVEAHGGQLAASSEGSGRGARFDVELPVRASNDAASPRPEPQLETDVRSLRILLVEDDRDTAESLALMLERRGLKVSIAASVEAALARAAEGFDVLVSDIALPDGTGRDLALLLAAKGPLRAIALSGFGSDADVRASRAAGFRAHLVKPVEPERLLRVIRRVAVA